MIHTVIARCDMSRFLVILMLYRHSSPNPRPLCCLSRVPARRRLDLRSFPILILARSLIRVVVGGRSTGSSLSRLGLILPRLVRLVRARRQLADNPSELSEGVLLGLELGQLVEDRVAVLEQPRLQAGDLVGHLVGLDLVLWLVDDVVEPHPAGLEHPHAQVLGGAGWVGQVKL